METSSVIVASLEQSVLTCAGEALLPIFLAALQLSALAQEKLGILNQNPRTKGDHHTSSASKQLDAESGDDNNDDNNDGDGGFEEGEEDPSSEDDGDFNNNNKNKNDSRKGLGGAGGLKRMAKTKMMRMELTKMMTMMMMVTVTMKTMTMETMMMAGKRKRRRK